MKKSLIGVLLLLILLSACKKKTNTTQNAPGDSAYVVTKTLVDDSFPVDVIIDKPQGAFFDVLMVFHGTVTYDSLIWALRKIHWMASNVFWIART
jgi:uncharacterized lipoprotein